MKKQFIISMLLLCGAQGAFGQACGSARDSDLSGNYTSSTSTDQCGGGYGGLQGSLSAPTLQQSTEAGTFLTLDYFTDTRLLFVNQKVVVNLTSNFSRVDRPTFPKKHFRQITGRKALPLLLERLPVAPDLGTRVFRPVTNARGEIQRQIASLFGVSGLTEGIGFVESLPDVIRSSAGKAIAMQDEAWKRSWA